MIRRNQPVNRRTDNLMIRRNQSETNLMIRSQPVNRRTDNLMIRRNQPEAVNRRTNLMKP